MLAPDKLSREPLSGPSGPDRRVQTTDVLNRRETGGGLGGRATGSPRRPLGTGTAHSADSTMWSAPAAASLGLERDGGGADADAANAGREIARVPDPELEVKRPRRVGARMCSTGPLTATVLRMAGSPLTGRHVAISRPPVAYACTSIRDSRLTVRPVMIRSSPRRTGSCWRKGRSGRRRNARRARCTTWDASCGRRRCRSPSVAARSKRRRCPASRRLAARRVGAGSWPRR
jgi:hypothetical protein